MRVPTENEVVSSGRLIRAYRVADIPPGAAPVPWSSPVLSPAQPSPPLEMRLPPKEEKAEKIDYPGAFSPEPGMILIPPGEFRMGVDEQGGSNASPQHAVLLDSYWIDRYPVTNADYRRFVQATGHQAPPHWIDGSFPPGHSDHPVVNVSWHDAGAYARWARKRLPTEAEWEKAARGARGQVYPWGDAFRKENLNCSGQLSVTTPVDAFPRGGSPYGVMDMCGNACEWVEDWYGDHYYRGFPVDKAHPINPPGPEGGGYKVVRGGFFGEDKMGVRCASRHYAPPSAIQDHIGFRCARTPLPLGQQSGDILPDTERIPEERPVGRESVGAEPISPDEPMGRIAERRPEDVAKCVRTLLLKASQEPDLRHRISVLILALGQDVASEVLKYLNDYEIEDIAQAMADLKTVTAEQRGEVLEGFRQDLVTGRYVSTGGIDFARGVLEKTVGPRRAQQMLDRVTATTSGGFYLLRSIAPSQIAPFLNKEHPQTIALTLSQLEHNQAAGVLNLLPEELQADVAYRLATMENISPRVLRELEERLAAELQAILTGQVAEIGGAKKVADILNRTGNSTEKSVLEKVNGRDPRVAEKIRNLMFTFEDIARLTDREIQLVLREVDTKDCGIALKGATQVLQDRVLSNVSEEIGAKIKAEMEFSGPIRMSDVEVVQLRIVQIVRKLEEAGQVRITRGEIPDVFV